RSSQTAHGKGKGKGPAARRAPGGSGGKMKGSICSGFISKYGVGALQAGFYIGSTLMVVTKTARVPDVCEFVMSEAKFEHRAETNADIFRDTIIQRNPGKKREEDPESERNGPSNELLERLRAEEVGKSHFTYIVLTLRNKHVEWLKNHKRSLTLELASMYHYYLHSGHCPDGIRRENDEPISLGDNGDEEDGHEKGAGKTLAGGRVGGSGGNGGSKSEPSSGGGDRSTLEITYARRNRPGHEAKKIWLSDVKNDLESRLNDARKDSFTFDMEMPDPRDNTKKLPATGVIHYYPYEREQETRPRARPDEEDDESITVEAFWEGRLVPHSHAASLSFFPQPKLSKKDREALGARWRRRIKGMLFFDWNFPISNNKLKLHFREGDLQS
ncbi:unnamed protein product, partial [Ectocarpus sp. 12 AP-2014]